MRTFFRLSCGDDAGNAQVEFIGVVLMLLIPIVYATVSFSHLQAAQYAVSASAHAVARSYALHGSKDDSQTIVSLALEDQGISVKPEHIKVSVSCPDECSEGQIVTANVKYAVAIIGLGWTGTTQVSVKASGSSYRGVMQLVD